MTQNAPDPFADRPDEEATDNRLITEALAGDRSALIALVNRHQPWIYNIAFRMVLTPQDAEDVTQEILIKLITKLSTFDPAKAKFRTWLYRVVANHVLNMAMRGGEAAVSSFDAYYGAVHGVPDEDPDGSPETQAVIAEIMTSCVQGVLLCLDRKQRLVFILVVAFNVSDAQGSEILGVSRANFRKILSRARTRLHQYMNGNCGVVNRDAPCHCHKKAAGFMARGWHTPDRIVFTQPHRPRIREVLEQKMERFDHEIHAEYRRLCQEHPFYEAPGLTAWLRDLLQRPDFKEIFETDEGGGV